MAKTKVDLGGQNVDAVLDENILTLTIDISKPIGPSKSGKTTLFATLNGNKTVIGRKKLGLNLYEEK